MSGEGMQTFGGGEWASGSTPSDRLETENAVLRQMLEEGMDVYDQNNDKIGTIEEISGAEPNTGQFFVTISRGLFGGGGDLYLPSSYLTVSSVQGSEDDKQVGVAVPKDQLKSMGWDQPPRWAHNQTEEPDNLETGILPDEPGYRDRDTLSNESSYREGGTFVEDRGYHDRNTFPEDPDHSPHSRSTR